jgi:hypothetical protein
MRTARATGLFLALASCAPQVDGPSPTAARNEVLARTLMTVWETGDANVLADLFSPQAVYDDFPNQTRYQGLEEIMGYVTHVHDWADAVSMGVTAVHASEEGAVVEWVFSAIQAAPIGTRVPVATGREVVLNGVTILEIDGRSIVRAADYMDVLPFVLQLGAEVHMPGGPVLRLGDVAPGGA